MKCYLDKLLFLSVLFFALQANAEETLFFLVRHAEKLDNSPDPELSAAGLQRAQALVTALEDYELEKIYSTNYRRTQSTAKPIANSRNLGIENYDPAKLSEFAQFLKEQDKSALIVGHSNTTPLLVKLLGGEPRGEINEKLEFDRLYIIRRDPSGAVESSLLRYGEQMNAAH